MDKYHLIEELKLILAGEPWQVRGKLASYIEKLESGEYRPAQRTSLQNRSLHLACRLLADALNEAGLDIRKIMKETVDIPWTIYAVKDYLLRPIMTTMTGKKSTTELEKLGEIDKIWNVLMRHLGEKHGVDCIEFPHEDKIAPMKK